MDSGFKHINESDSWDLKKGGKYFFTRNQSALFAFTIGEKLEINNTKFKIIGTHTDSPNLRIAPNSWVKSGVVEKLHLEKYGGGQWQTWFDRDLSLAGKIVYKEDNQLQTKIIRINEPLFNIPSLAIHLVPGRNKPFDWNDEVNLKLILSMGLGIESEEIIDNKDTKKENSKTEFDRKLGSKLADLISKEANISKESLIDFELVCYDTMPACIMGINKEYISSGRLDNLQSSLVAADSIIKSAETLSIQDSINMVAMFDNEEVGSSSYQGADNDMFGKTLERIFITISDAGTPSKDSFFTACNKSFVISADLAHASHPNYEDKHHSSHRIAMHAGVVIKHNAMLRYATDSEGSVIIKDIAKNLNVPIQDFIVKQDSPCGSTIGPIISSHLGIRTVDIGIGVWGMHSIRETGSSIDSYYYYQFMTGFFNDIRKTYNSGI